MQWVVLSCQSVAGFSNVSIVAVSVAEPNQLIEAVVKHGQDRWDDFGEVLGFSVSEIKALTYETPHCSGKLRKLIKRKQAAVGIKATAASLMQACKKLDIMGIVAEELGLE